eukprot:INCI4611.1.p1 GENE.INCI4611.1~~INCI4611.1.p1  ORF type:complete len:253 (+),score=24.72 INCI4611.1:329-1087(+)
MGSRTPSLLVVFCCGILVLLSSTLASATCSWLDPHSGLTFDLSSLTRPAADPYIFPGGNSVYLANVCGIVSQGCPRSPSRKDATGVQLANGHCLAKIGGLVAPEWANVDKNDPSKGVLLTYGSGDHCDTIGKPRTMIFEVLCDPTKQKPEIEGGVEGTDDSLCSYTLTMHSAAGCPSHSLGTGWTVLIIGGILFSAYCVGGLFWNIKREGLSGADAIPNAKAWRELPSLVAGTILGVIFLVQFWCVNCVDAM